MVWLVINVKSKLSLLGKSADENVEEFSEDERDSFTINWVEGRWDCERLGVAGQTKNDKEIEEVGGLDETIAIQVPGAGGVAWTAAVWVSIFAL